MILYTVAAPTLGGARRRMIGHDRTRPSRGRREQYLSVRASHAHREHAVERRSRCKERAASESTNLYLALDTCNLETVDRAPCPPHLISIRPSPHLSSCLPRRAQASRRRLLLETLCVRSFLVFKAAPQWGVEPTRGARRDCAAAWTQHAHWTRLLTFACSQLCLSHFNSLNIACWSILKSHGSPGVSPSSTCR